ncbi:translesion error-prone DNA polymerase V subunit UmuC [Klebsiella pneumoniae]|uniref:translesion error-prone DNA polymerase V subunit UmuC n=1 Tax=Klebsiella/Raoultella group TaxID=2890311 RepID=UPI00092D948A|nr:MULTISPECIES: translesion error-prone DNA polymerase V subunit UmuC [Klebsiella/Raoultella group]HBW1846510.1 translesion error-prone DNA polymerase V subunit UmuC [Klebsiella quasipneumoniae subsp. quasipneumoniae]HCM5371386.1 translesion error-prone DNA polymerase V subunit UmuC [Klebsiella variicola subsp. variicola]APM46727.1 DNA polymerase V subunit UmuC [Klebsiella pneumoniae]ATR12701.1 translesion error-prone DNA polymerase V subunit UmuC [Klebsiella pneumoniae]EKJ7112079.1 translesi
MYALADVNSFYCSVEKCFRPDLRDKPVVVLSNNDGCVIARCKLAKKFGIPMGSPWFKLREQRFPEPVIAFSSNYELYASMSARVHFCLEELSSRVEEYSIDESFIWAGGIDNCMTFEEYGHQLRDHVFRCTGLTIGVGLAPTKTLAKACQYSSKTWPQFGGVLALTAGQRNRIDKMLSLMPVEEVWGVGGRTTSKLHAMGITTALELARTNPAFIRRNFTVVLERTVRELRGESCIDLEDAPPPKQQIICSRSFGQRITTYESMRQAICQYAERAAEKLRQERQYCGQVSVFIKTSPFSKHEPYYSKVSSEQLCIPSRDTRDIIAAAGRALDKIWKEGHNYAKAGVMLNDFRPCGVTQLSLFDEGRSYANSDALMNVLDTINNSGKGKVWFAGRGIAPAWSMKRDMLSPAYTTRWDSIPIATL